MNEVLNWIWPPLFWICKILIYLLGIGGKSLLCNVTEKDRFGFYGHEFHVDTNGISTVIDTKNPYGETEEQLIELFNSFVE